MGINWPADPPDPQVPPYDRRDGERAGDEGRASWQTGTGHPGNNYPPEAGAHYGYVPRAEWGSEDPFAADQWRDPDQARWRDPYQGYGHDPYHGGAHRGQWRPGQTPGARAAQGRPPPPAGQPAPDGDGEYSDVSWTPTLAWTIGCFLVPITLYLTWAATRSGTPPPDCLDDRGAPCLAPRVETLVGLFNIAPGLIGAITLALLAAVGLRLMIDTWRPSTVGVAAAVVGAGTATLIATVVA